ncbi:MAG: SET domain-containing protein-lysine N-methyltransferase, partial [bacterium]
LVYSAEVHSPPGAGKGLFALRDLPAFTLVGIYTGGDNLTPTQVTHPSHVSDYVVTHQHLVRDALDPKTKRILCDVAYINDSLDTNLHNCDWYIHPSYPNLLLVITTTHIPNDAQLYIPYGPDYWCQDKFPIEILLAAINGYNIDIHSQPQWIKLQCYPTLCTHIP